MEAKPQRRNTLPAVHYAGDDVVTQLLQRCAKGDHDAFAEFYDRTCGTVYTRAYRVLRDQSLAETVTQDVYLEVWCKADSFNGAQGSAIAWLVWLAHHRAVDRVRADRARTERDAAYAARHRSRNIDPVQETVLRQIECHDVRNCLSALTDLQRESIVLAYYGGYTASQIAAILDSTVPAVKTRIRDGIIRLRNATAAKGFGLSPPVASPRDTA